jgi:hypothetical protein
MCLACEMDGWWFAEMEAAAARTPGTAGVPPALQDGVPSPTPAPSETAGGTPAVPGFVCEETRSE